MMHFGQQLRQAREKAGMSLNEISARTKIRVSVLDTIERADLARLPAPFYTKAFLRAYAAEVHLDAEPIVKEYLTLSETSPSASPQTGLATDRDTVPNMSELFGLLSPRLAPAAMVALAGLLLFFAFKLGHGNRLGPSSEDEPGAVATTGAAPSVATTGAAPSPPAAQTSAAGERSIVTTSPQPEVLTVEVRPAGLLWLEGTADGERVIRRLLQPGENLVVQARNEIKLVIGDAGAFDYSIEGLPGRRLGRPGQVRTIDVNWSNYREFLLTAPNGSP